MALRLSAALPPVRPVIPVPGSQPFDHPDWLFEPKYDGLRGLLHVTGRECYFLSKRGDILERFQELGYWVREELPAKEAILDGEIVALDHRGRQSFRGLVAGSGHLHYAAFDALWLRGRDLRGLPLSRRKRALHHLVPAATTVVSQVFSIEGRGRDAFAAAERLDLEGIVAKRTTDPYASSTVWYEVLNQAYTQKDGRPQPFDLE